MDPIKVLFTGATGYMASGGSVLTTLANSADESINGRLQFTAVVRKLEQSQLLEAEGLKTIVFNGLEDVALMHNLAKDHDTGTGSVADRPITGSVVEDRIFSDKSDNIYEYLKKRQELEDFVVRRTDVAIIEKGRALNVPTFILMSPTIYGTGTGYFNKRSIQIPILVRAAVKAKHAEILEDGKSRWSNIHIQDLATLYECLISKILKSDPVASGEKGIYFTVSGEHQWADIAKSIAKEGHGLGIFENSDVHSISLEEGAEKWLGGNKPYTEIVFGSNSRTKSDLAREYGWKPRFGEDFIYTTIAEEFKWALGQHAGRFIEIMERSKRPKAGPEQSSVPTTATATTKRKNTTKACEECRRRRAKCDADGRQPAPRSYVTLLQKRIKLLEAVLLAHNIDVDQSIHQLTQNNPNWMAEQDATVSTAGSSDVADLSEELRGVLTLDESLNFDQDGEIRYFGPTSGRLKFSQDTEGRDAGPQQTSPELEGLRSTGDISRQKLNQVYQSATRYDQLNDPLVNHLVDLYFRWENPWNPVLNEAVFRRSWRENGKYFSPLLLNAILALGSRYSDRTEVRSDPNDPKTAGRKFLEKAEILLYYELK
ncbi:hypothetical protein Daesc_003637 [Daldinia eschscholtzii]|uniref:Xylanolytic transcriptional activator regulatory domain-containing protein n=1 Tax=Daldinia eschscholtzii TaxID=292717 RepID=A0AAX6MTJ9_9PEZI